MKVQAGDQHAHLDPSSADSRLWEAAGLETSSIAKVSSKSSSSWLERLERDGPGEPLDMLHRMWQEAECTDRDKIAAVIPGQNLSWRWRNGKGCRKGLQLRE